MATQLSDIKNSTSLFQENKQNRWGGVEQKGETCVKSIREFLTNESIRNRSEIEIKK
jgi:hypothetical protein